MAVALGLVALAVAVEAQFPLTARSALLQIEEAVLLLYTSVRSGMLIRRDSPRIGVLVAYLWVYSLFGVVQVVQLSKDDNPFHIPISDPLVERQLAVVLAGLLAMDVAARAGWGLKARPIATMRPLSLSRVVIVSWLVVLSTPLLAARSGGTAALFTSRLAVTNSFGGVQNLSTLTAVLREGSNVAPFMCLYALLRLRQARSFRFTGRPDLSALLVVLIAVNVLFNNPLSQPRFWIATMIIAFALSGRWIRRAGFQVALVVVYLAASLVAFPYLDLTRNAGLGDATGPSGSITDLYVNKADYVAMEDTAYAIQYVDEHGHTDGKQILGAVLFFVPRSTWPGKADDTAKLIAANIGWVQNFNLDSPLWAEGYVDFGWFGVIAVLGIFGWAIGCGDRKLLRAPPATFIAIVVPTTIGYELLFIRGSMLQAMARLSLIFLFGWLLSRRGPDRALPSDARGVPVSGNVTMGD